MKRKCINNEKLNKLTNFKGERLKLCEHTLATLESMSWLSRQRHESWVGRLSKDGGGTGHGQGVK
jgi:hypothetical protein